MTYTQTKYDPLTTLGFDRIFDRMTQLHHATSSQGSYPPYNIIKESEMIYVVELALAGFTESDLNVVVKDGILTIEGDSKGSTDTDTEYLHKGIAARAFTRTFTLAETIVVKDATFKDGVLKVKLENVIPEELKPRTIAINSSESEKQFLSE